MKICLIGNGAIAGFVSRNIETYGHQISAFLLRPERVAQARPMADVTFVSRVGEIPSGTDIVVDCAGHAALAKFGPGILARGYDLITVSIGALADRNLEQALEQAAVAGGTRLYLTSGAIGALDALRAARCGNLETVHYVGRKPPLGWKGSPAETQMDLQNMTGNAEIHFKGTARNAALGYPKNANVAAAVALSGLGFDATKVTLIADPNISENIHEIHATGDFGSFEFRISGRSLVDNPRSSALAAMSVLSSITQKSSPIAF